MEDNMSLFQPPLIRSTRAVLDRTVFTKTFPISAARVFDNKNIAKFRVELGRSKEMLRLDRLTNVRPHPDLSLAAQGAKCLLLKPEVKPGVPTTWSATLKEAVEAEELGVFPYDLVLDYDYWDYDEIMKAFLPEDVQHEIPSGFAIVGHVAHLNLRPEYLPYKNVIAEVLIDKTSAVRTVINKLNDVGTDSEYRTFDYEVIGGPDDMNVEMHEGGCDFNFDYSKVYWNSRLQTEHKRLVDLFEPREVVVDVMAGIGPFACPAGRKGVFVWANDLNPDSYASLKKATTRNNVHNFVRPFNMDGRTFIRTATDAILGLAAAGKNIVRLAPRAPKRSRTAPVAPLPPLPPPEIIPIPRTVNHFVMNLPATAIQFLGPFRGLYEGHEALFEPHTEARLPTVHVYCFSTKSDDNAREAAEICGRISKRLGYEMRPGEGEGEGEVHVLEVRNVAPNKRMFCASFRLPAEVAFASRL